MTSRPQRQSLQSMAARAVSGALLRERRRLELRPDGPSRMDAELREDILGMMSHRVGTHTKLLRDLPVGGPPREETRHLRLATSEPESREARRGHHLAVLRDSHRDPG